MGDSPKKKTIWFSIKFDLVQFFPSLLCTTWCHCTSIPSFQSLNVL